MKRLVFMIVAGAWLGSGCTDARFANDRKKLQPYCYANVEGIGRRDVEADYLPHVIACENGRADFEALKAQAVAARSYLYYVQDWRGVIGDGQHDQVYTCRAKPKRRHYAAARATRGQILRHDHGVIAGFYVAGAKPKSCSCIAEPSDPDPTKTERFVTYNWERRGKDVRQTPLGRRHPDNRKNRGAMSQNGSQCLARQGWGHGMMLEFYYGADIKRRRVRGQCYEKTQRAAQLEARRARRAKVLWRRRIRQGSLVVAILLIVGLGIVRINATRRR